jgi:hypothetical protein
VLDTSLATTEFRHLDLLALLFCEAGVEVIAETSQQWNSMLVLLGAGLEVDCTRCVL